MSRRIHEMDALRAFTMLLGVVYHAARSSASLAHGSTRDRLIDLSYGHYRMPLFFVVAGYFAAVFVSKRGAREFVAARLRRIGIPLAVGLVTLIPAMHFAADLALPDYRAPLLPLRPQHLWFLWYLLLFSGTALAVRWLVQVAGLQRLAEIVRAPVHHRWWLPPAVLVLAAVLRLKLGSLENPRTFLPSADVFVGYGLFFAFGWALFGNPDPVGHLGRGWRVTLPAGIVLLIAGRGMAYAFAGEDVPRGVLELAVLVSAGATWCMISGLMGATRHWYRAESPVVRYAADASYWTYLVHFPIVLLALYAGVQIGLPVFANFLFSLTAAYAFSFATYAVGVRHTAIGRVLHGPRPRSRSRGRKLTPAPEPAL